MNPVCTVDSELSHIRAKDGLTNFDQHIIAKCGRGLDVFCGARFASDNGGGADRDNQSP